MRRGLLLGLTGWIWFGACGELHRPELCVFSADQFGDPQAATLEECRDLEFKASDGDVMYVLHELPEGVEVEADLNVTVATPLTTMSFTQTHADRRVIFAFVAPKGASCSLQVTATILNETQRRISIPSNPASCHESGDGGAGGQAGAGG